MMQWYLLHGLQTEWVSVRWGSSFYGVSSKTSLAMIKNIIPLHRENLVLWDAISPEKLDPGKGWSEVGGGSGY